MAHPSVAHLHRALLALALAALALTAFGATAASAKSAKKPKPTPVVTTISPLKAKVGQTLIIRGRNFLRGSGRNTVVFKRDGAVAVFVKAGSSSTTRMRVRIPNKLLPFFAVQGGRPVPSRFRVRVLAARFGRKFTAIDRSPEIDPAISASPFGPGTTPTGGPIATPASDCDKDGSLDTADDDDDNDLLADGLEEQIKTSPCSADSDGDTIEDGFEYVSALDLNDRALPYPGKRPYPNALDGSDPDLDHDGDAMTMREEHEAWKRFGTRSLDLNYSAGTQKTRIVAAVSYRGTPIDFDRDGTIEPHETAYLDLDGDGELSDEEQDIDGDGLSNYDETHGYMNRAGVDGLYEKKALEKPYPLPFLLPDWLDKDSDGDGVLDGADDQDHDDVSNLAEISRLLAVGLPRWTDLLPPELTKPQTGWIQPYNPCLPDIHSRTCGDKWPLDEAPSPWNFGFPHDYAILH